MSDTTTGPNVNEKSVKYAHGDGAHSIIVLERVSPDILLVHQSKMVGFYKKVSPKTPIDPVPRDVKHLMLKDYQ